MNNVYKPGAMFFPRPYIMFSGQPCGSDTIADLMSNNRDEAAKETIIEFNKLGFRIDRDLLKKKRHDEFRIFMVGGSTVLNGSSISMSLPGQLEELFRDNGKKNVQVSNFGIPSYVAAQELSLIVHVLPELEPDVIVVYDGGNDVTQPCFYDPRPGYPFNYFVTEVLVRRLQKYGIDNFSKGIEKDLDLEKFRQDAHYATESWEIQIAKGYAQNVWKMFRVVAGFGYNLFLFLQPIITFKNPLLGQEHKIPCEPSFHEYVRRQYQRILTLFDEIQASDGATRGRIFDLSKIFDNYAEETFWDYIHIDDRGNKHVAQHMYNSLSSLI